MPVYLLNLCCRLAYNTYRYSVH